MESHCEGCALGRCPRARAHLTPSYKRRGVGCQMHECQQLVQGAPSGRRAGRSTVWAIEQGAQSAATGLHGRRASHKGMTCGRLASAHFHGVASDEGVGAAPAPGGGAAAHGAQGLCREASARPGSALSMPRGRSVGIYCVFSLATVFGVLGGCIAAEGSRREAAFAPVGGIGRLRACSAGALSPSCHPGFNGLAINPRGRAVGSQGKTVRIEGTLGMTAQLPGHRGAGRCWPGVGRERHEILGLQSAGKRHSACRTALSASTLNGGGRMPGSGDDEFHYPEGTTKFIAECDLPTDRGNFRMRAYTYRGAKMVVREGENVLEWTEMEPVIIYKGNLRGNERALVRVHDQCYTSEVLGSKRCDCRQQLELALDYINQHGGAVIYMPQEGRGIGLANKIAAYQLQDGGLDTVDANRALGFGDDERVYDCVPFMLKDMGIQGIRLMTNNPFKIRQLTELGVKVVGAKAHIVESNDFNAKYLRTKATRMAHALPHLEIPDPDAAPRAPAPSEAAKQDAAGASDLRWRFGKKSVEAAAKAMVTGAAVVVVDGARHNQGWLVACAEGISTNTLGLINQLGDSISVPVAQEAMEAVEEGWGGCQNIYHSASTEPVSPSGARELLAGRIGFLRRLAAVTGTAAKAKQRELLQRLPAQAQALASVLAPTDSSTVSNGNGDASSDQGLTWNTVRDDCMAQRFLPVRAQSDVLMGETRSPCDAAVELARMARLPPVAVVSPLLSADRMDAMSFAQVLSLSLSVSLSLFPAAFSVSLTKKHPITPLPHIRGRRRGMLNLNSKSKFCSHLVLCRW